jgi:hypothetical protein
LPEELLLPEPLPEEVGEDGKPKRIERPLVDWVRIPKQRTVTLPVRNGRGGPIVVPESAAEQRRGGGLALETHSRLFSFTTPDGKTARVRALTVFLVNRRATVHRYSMAEENASFFEILSDWQFHAFHPTTADPAQAPSASPSPR